MSVAESARIRQLRQDLTAERARTARSARITGILGLLVLLALAAYFYFGYRLLDETAQPERVVTVGVQLLDDNIGQVRQGVQEQVATQSPVWAEGLSQQAQAALPTGREKLEEYVMTQVEDALKRGTVLTEDRFREFLRKNQATLERDLQELTKSPELAEQSIAELQAAVEKELGSNMMDQSRDFRAALTGIIEKLEKYESGVGLTTEEQNERRILLLARALQQQEQVTPTRRRGQELPVAVPAPPTALPAPAPAAEPADAATPAETAPAPAPTPAEDAPTPTEIPAPK